jgi:hypothetical protein
MSICSRSWEITLAWVLKAPFYTGNGRPLYLQSAGEAIETTMLSIEAKRWFKYAHALAWATKDGRLEDWKIVQTPRMV